MYWVHCYTVQSEAIQKRLCHVTNAALSTDAFFHRAAGLAVTDEIAEGFYRDILIPRLNALGDNSLQLSDQLKEPGTPPLVKIWMENSSLEWEPKSALSKLDDSYKVIFADRREGRYLHVAYPCRDENLGVHVGGAGCYLFLTNEAAYKAMPRCLLTHLRVFVQAIVTAELWRVAEVLRAHEEERRQREEKNRVEMVKKSTDIRRNAGTLRLIAKAAEELASLADPLALDTTAFDRAAALAGSMFALPATEEQARRLGKRRKLDGSCSPIHTVAEWLKLPADAITVLRQLVNDLNAIHEDESDASYHLIRAVTNAISIEIDHTAKGDANRSVACRALERALRHAKALDHSSVVAGILCKSDLIEMQTIYPRNRVGATDEPGPRYRKQALAELWTERERLACEFVRGELWQFSIPVQESEKEKSLQKADDILVNRAGSGERDFATKLARIIRGLRGKPTEVGGAYKTRECAGTNNIGVEVYFSPRLEE